VGVGTGVGEGDGLSKPNANVPMAEISKCTELNPLIAVTVLSRIWCGSVNVADVVQPATSATITTRQPAALAMDLLRTT